MLNRRTVAVFVIGGCSVMAQEASRAAYQGQSWVGLLVPANCVKFTKGQADRSKSNRESDLTVTSRTTTPAVDQSGTRGQSTALDPGANPPSGKNVSPETGDVLSQKGSRTDPGWTNARRQAKGLNDSCRISTGTNQFALLLPDGGAVAFDDLANQAILKQLPALPTDAKNRPVLRVQVSGKLQDGKIALDTIRM